MKINNLRNARDELRHCLMTRARVFGEFEAAIARILTAADEVLSEHENDEGQPQPGAGLQSLPGQLGIDFWQELDAIKERVEELGEIAAGGRA